MREVLYCAECGARLNLYVIGVCSRCNFDLTGEDEDRREERWEAPPRVEGDPERIVTRMLPLTLTASYGAMATVTATA